MESSTERPGAVGAEQLDALDTADNEIVRQRVEKLRRLRGEEGYDPYVVEKWERRDTLKDVGARFAHLESGQTDDAVTVRTAGRLMTLRRQGKATFADLADEEGQRQDLIDPDGLGTDRFRSVLGVEELTAGPSSLRKRGSRGAGRTRAEHEVGTRP